jgi:hypothetical protein
MPKSGERNVCKRYVEVFVTSRADKTVVLVEHKGPRVHSAAMRA